MKIHYRNIGGIPGTFASSRGLNLKYTQGWRFARGVIGTALGPYQFNEKQPQLLRSDQRNSASGDLTKEVSRLCFSLLKPRSYRHTALTPAARELTATYASALNDCHYCQTVSAKTSFSVYRHIASDELFEIPLTLPGYGPLIDTPGPATGG